MIRRVTAVLSLFGLIWLAGCGGNGSATTQRPLIASLSPNAVVAGGPDVVVTVNGANFLSSSIVRFNGANRPTTFISASQLKVVLTASDVALGAVNTITVANASSSTGSSTGAMFTVNNPTPTTASVTPNFVPEGSSGLTLTIMGSGFLPISSVQLNGSIRPTTFISNSALQVAIAAADVKATGGDNLNVSNPAPGGGDSNPQTFTVTVPPPTITRVTPSSAVRGDGDFTATITGTGFKSGATVQFNGSPRTTTFASSTQLQAQITAADIATVGLASITVANPISTSLVPGQSVDGPTSAPASFFTGAVGGPGFAAVIINQSAENLVFDSAHRAIYLTVPSDAESNPDSISVIDLPTASLVKSVPAGPNPHALAISDDDQFLYAGIDGASIVQRFNLPTLAKDVSYSLGSNQSSPLLAFDLQVAPGASHTTAVTLGNPKGLPPGAGIVVFDDTTPRPIKAQATSNGSAFNSIQWGADINTLYAVDSENTAVNFFTFSVNANGITEDKDFEGTFHFLNQSIHFDPGTKLVYADDGGAVTPSSGMPAGRLNTVGGGGVLVTDSHLNGAYSAGFGGSAVIVSSSDLTRFTQVDQISIPVVGTVIHLIRWGQNGLAFNTSNGQLVLLAGNFLDPIVSSTPNPPPNITPTPTPTPTAQTPIITSMAPSATIAGGTAFTLIVNGVKFDSKAQVFFNGSPRTTNFVSSTQLNAVINAADIGKVGVANVTVVNPNGNGSTSGSSTFFIGTTMGAGLVSMVINQEAADIAYDPMHQVIYLSVPVTASTNGNTISVLDLSTATIPFFQFAGSDPNLLAISDDSRFLYVSQNGFASVQRFTLPILSPDISYFLGRFDSFGPLLATDLQVAPGASHTSAVTRGGPEFGLQPLIVFDDATPRPAGQDNDLNKFQWGADPNTIFATSQLKSDIFSLVVTANGVTQNQDFLDRAGDAGIHFNPTTNLIYSDDGLVVNPSTGIPVGSFAASGLMVPDPSLNAAFFLSGNTIQVFDLTRFTPVGSFTIPDIVRGTPRRFIRWGQNGLAFNTDTGQMFLIAGDAVAPVVSPALTPPPNTVPPPPPTPTAQTPTISALAPSSAVKGGPDFALTVNGTNFDPAAQIQFNGKLLATKVVSSTQLTASVSASEIAAIGVDKVTVVNPADNGGPSLPSTFFVGATGGTSAGNVGFSVQILDQSTNDLVYDPINQLIYLSVPASAGAMGNTIAALQLSSATIPFAQFAGSEPGILSISQDSQFLYAGVNGSFAVQRFILPGLGIDLKYPLAAESFSPAGFGPSTAIDLKVAPGAPHTNAITFGLNGSPQGGVAIFDDGTARATQLPASGNFFSSLQWGTDANILFAANGQPGIGDLAILDVNSSGVTLTHDFPGVVGSNAFPTEIHYDPNTNLVYGDGGQIVNLSGTAIGSFSPLPNNDFIPYRMMPDSTLNKASFVSPTTPGDSQSVTVRSFDLTSHTLLDSLTIPGAVGNVLHLIRWGTNGLAFNTSSGQVVLIAGSFVR